jgi:hypothetical protein
MRSYHAPSGLEAGNEMSFYSIHPGRCPISVNLRPGGPQKPQSGGRMWPTAHAVGRHVPLTFPAPAGATDQERIVLAPLRG